MAFAWRAAVVLLVFAGVGVATAKIVITHAVNAGAAQSQVYLAGAMAGLFAGGLAALLAGIALALSQSRRN